MRGLTSTLVLLLILAGLGGYIYFYERESTPGAAEEKAKAFTVSPENIEEIIVRNTDGVSTRVQRVDANWRIVEPEKTDADAAEVAAITSSVAGLDIQRVVDENPGDVKQYGLEPPKMEIAFRERDAKEFRKLLVGEKTPTGSDLYAKTPDSNRVFLISGYLDATFNKSTFNFRDKDILKFDRDKADTLEIADASDALQFRREGTDWRIVKPIVARGDYANIESLMQRLSAAQMQTLLAAEGTGADIRKYGLDSPRIRVNVGVGSSRATLLLGEPDASGNPVAKDAARPPIFTIDQGLLAEFSKDVGEFRRKDLFDFRSFTANRIEVTRDGQTLVLEKTKGTDGKEAWRDGGGKALETASVEELLTKITNLRAQAYQQTPHPALKTPALTVAARFDTNKSETVTFARAGEDVYAARADEPGSGKLESGTFDEAVKALDGMK